MGYVSLSVPFPHILFCRIIFLFRSDIECVGYGLKIKRQFKVNNSYRQCCWQNRWGKGRKVDIHTIPGRKVIDLSMMQRVKCMQSVLRSRLIYLERGVAYSGQCWLLVASWVCGMFLSRWALVVSISASMKILFMIPFSIFWSGWRRDWLTAIEQVIF